MIKRIRLAIVGWLTKPYPEVVHPGNFVEKFYERSQREYDAQRHIW